MFGYETILTLGEKGRVTLPAKVREMLQIEKGDILRLELQDGIITLFPVTIEKKEEA